MMGRPGPASHARDRRVAGLERHRQLGHAERLGRILEPPLGLGLRVGELLDQPHLFRDELHHLGHAQAEHHATPYRRGGVVDVDDGAARAAQGFYGAADQFLARLREHHDRHVVGHQLLLDEIAHGLKVRVRRGRKPDFDFLETHRAQRLEQPLLGFAAHGLEQRLVAVAKVGAAPHRHVGELRGMGHCRLGRSMGGNGRYFFDGSFNMAASLEMTGATSP